jgi:hypothetical protein
LNRRRVCHSDRHRRWCQKLSDQKAEVTENTYGVFPIPAEVKRGNSDPILNSPLTVGCVFSQSFIKA